MSKTDSIGAIGATEQRRLRVLFAEDSPADVELIRQSLLRAGFDVMGDATDRLDRFRELVAGGQYDVILADYGLPGWNGMDALEVLGALQKRIPLILVTGSLGDERAVQCIKAGVCDYVLKDSLTRLPHAVERALQESAHYRERQEAQEELRRVNRALMALSRCNQAMLAATREPDLLQAICDLVVQVGGYRLAWIGFAERTPGKAVSPVAQAGLEQEYLRGIDVRWDDSDHGRGPTGTAIRTGRPFIVRDLEEPRFAPWREMAYRHGIHSSVALPLCASDGAVLGAISIYAGEENAFNTQEMKLLQELAANLSFGILALRARQEREQAQADLQRYAAELERSNRELQDFASIASHDLQEPLRKIIAFGDRLAEHAAARLDETGHDYLRRMQNAAGRMSSLIDALLQYSRVATRAEAFQAVDLAVLIFEVLVDLEVRIQESGARVQVGPLPILQADRTQMRQLLQNLLSNALKFRRSDSAPLVEVASRPLPGCQWEISIRDNGVGFEETYLDRIFRPFQRLHSRSEFNGTGMGLAICRKIVARHGGAITARSQPGQGSTFIVTLPAANIQEAPCRTAEFEGLSLSPKMTTTTSC